MRYQLKFATRERAPRRGDRRFIIFGCWLLAVATAGLCGEPSASGAGRFRICPPPAWVEKLGFDANSPAPAADVTEGVYYLLADEQISVPDQSHYFHFVKKILDEDGVQDNSEISMDFDPSYQVLSYHRARLWREGRPLDRLEPAKIRLIQRESNLETHEFDGRLSAVLFLEDVRAGDIIEYAASIDGTNPVFRGKYIDTCDIGFSDPVRTLRYRLLWPQDRRLNIRGHRTAATPRKRDLAGITEYVWEFTHVPALLEDEDLPDWYDPYPWIQLSEFADWREVAAWARSYYDLGAPLSPDLRAEIGRLSRDNPRTADRVVAALRFVQGSIRYLGIHFGPHSHQPNPPNLVYQRRYGDCKDKALLLVTMLREMDIEASPALVNTEDARAIAGWLPSPFTFDHVVVQVRLDGREYWLDPTMSHQGGRLGHISLPDYGHALVVNPDTTGLTRLPSRIGDEGLTDIRETFTLAKDSGPVRLRVRSVFTGPDADEMRISLSAGSRKELEKRYLNFYAEQYPDIRLARPVDIRDDLNVNRLETTEEYWIGDLWRPAAEAGERSASFYPKYLRSLVAKPGTRLRTMPLGIDYPLHVRQTITVELPEPYAIEPHDIRIADPVMEFHHRRGYRDRTLTLFYEYRTLADSLDAAGTPEHIRRIGSIQGELGYVLSRSNDSVAVSPVPAGQLPSPAGPGVYPNWPVVLLGLLVFAVCVYAARQTFRWPTLATGGPVNAGTPPLPAGENPAAAVIAGSSAGASLLPASPADPGEPGNPASDFPASSHPEPAISGPSGIGGWLVPLALGLAASLLLIFIHLFQGAFYLDTRHWSNLTLPGSPGFHPLWAPALLFGMLCGIFRLVLGALLLVALFRKKKLFPALAFVFIAASMAFAVGEFGWGVLLFPAGRETIFPELRLTIGVIVASLPWIPYLFLSRRVRNTFVH